MTLNQRVRGSSVGTPMEESPRMYGRKALKLIKLKGFFNLRKFFVLVICL
jgi:hypothetical protein